MVCPKCGNQVERSLKFCPNCAHKLRAGDAAASAQKPSVTAEDVNQNKDQDQVPKDVKEEQEITIQNKGQPASDDLKPTSDSRTSEDRSDNSARPVTSEQGATPLADKEDSLSATAQQESISQPCSEAALALSPQPITFIPASDKTEVKSDNTAGASPDVEQTPANKPSDIHSATLLSSESSQTSAKETDSSPSEPPDQTSQECDSVVKELASDQEKDETQNLSNEKDGRANCSQEQNGSDDPESARDGATTQDTLGSTTSQGAEEEKGALSSLCNQTVSESIAAQKPQVFETCREVDGLSATAPEGNFQPCSEAAPAPNLSEAGVAESKAVRTEQQTDAPDISTEDSRDPVQIPANKPSDIHSAPLLNSGPLQTSAKETSSTSSEPSDQTLQECNSVEEKAAVQRAQNLSEKQEDDKTYGNIEQQTSAKQRDKKEDQAARNSADSRAVTQETAKRTEAFDTKSNDKTSSHQAARQEPEGNRKVDTNISPMPFCSPNQANDERLGPQVAVKTLETSFQHKVTQTLPSSEHMFVYFHAVTPKDFGPKERIVLLSGKLFGQWRTGMEMFISRELGDKRYLVERKVEISKKLMDESIPYIYAIYKDSDHTLKDETIYKKNVPQIVNRCLTIKEDLLTNEGEWHQYDDVIHPELKRNIMAGQFSTKEIVIKGRDLAGRVMLDIIFDFLKTWNKPNVENFFLLLQQFFYTYSCPALHDGVEKRFVLPYGSEQVKNLLKHYLKENLNPTPGKKNRCLLPSLHAGVVRLLIYNRHLKEDLVDQLSGLCDLLCFPNLPQHNFKDFWETFARPLPNKNSIADAVETLCNSAKEHHVEKWAMVIPLIHLLRGESKPFEPVPPVFKPQFESWTALKRSEGIHVLRDSSAGSLIGSMKKNAHLADIDRLLVHSWMSLLHLDDLQSFTESVRVEPLDMLQYLQFSIKPGMTDSNYKTLRELASHLINKLSHRSESFEKHYGECFLKTAGSLLDLICSHTTDPRYFDVPLAFLDLFCLIAKSYNHTDSQSSEGIPEEIFWDTLETVRKWRRSIFKNKLLNAWTQVQFSVPHEVEVWKKLLSVSFHREKHTESWRMALKEDFEGKLKREKPVDQIGIYSNKMEELRETSPLLCSIMEKCALEAIAVVCQDKSGIAVNDLLKKHDITKFGKLMSVVVLRTWPKDANGHDIEGEDLVFDYLIEWPMANTVFNMTVGGGRLISGLSDEAQIRMTLASSAFKSMTQKFLSGEIQMKTLEQILKRDRHFVDLLKIDGFCDDGRCKDDRSIKRLLKQRKDEAEAIQSERELVKTLLHICRELPQHVKVDFKGLDEKLEQNIEVMNLNEFMEVHTLDGQTSHTSEVTYFNLCDITRQMASELDAIKDSVIFKMCWKKRVEDLSREQSDTEDGEHLSESEEIYTLDQVYSKIFQTCYSQYKALYEGLKSGELPLEEIDSILEDYKGNYEDLQKDVDIMCRTNPSDDRKWIKKRIQQIEQYSGLNIAMESAQIIMGIRNAVCPEGDFKLLEKLLQMSQKDFKKSSLNCIGDNFIKAKEMLSDITNDHKECLNNLHQSLEFVQWVQKELEDINELKVFVDLASIYAGENDMEVDRVACFHDAVLGYSSMLYGLKPDSDFDAFRESLTKLWKALENDKKIPEKLRDTARQLEWLKSVRDSHGSVEFSSLSLAASINERGVYIIKAQNEKRLTLETSLKLQIEGEHEKSMTCTYEDLKELQNKLMLMSGRGEQNQSEVECFAEVFDNVQRLVRVFVGLYTAGNPLFKCWEASIFCKAQSDPCITMEIQFCQKLHHIQVCGNLVEQLAALSQKMELFLDDWRNFMNKQRSVYYYLNFFTADQLFYLCSSLTQTNVDVELEDKALMMLSFIKPNCTTSDVWRTWKKFHDQFEPGKRGNEDIPFKSHFHHLDSDDSHVSANVSHFTAEGPADSEVQTAGLKELEELWNGYIENEGIFFHELLDIRSLGSLLKMMTATEDQNEIDFEHPMLSETKDSSLRRSLPKGLHPSQPNLIICPHDDVLTSSICLYMTSEYEPLPGYDEVLLCTPATSLEQVELFLRRCLTPGDIGQKIYTMLWADKLTYDVSCAMEKCFQDLHSLFKRDPRLVIFCSSEREHTYIPTAFSQCKRDFVPQESLERIQKYLSRHYTLPSDHKSAWFKGDHSVGIVASQRAGVGKSLYVQRLYEKLEGSVENGTALKKCIRVTEREVNEHKVLQSLYDTQKQGELKMFHFDITSSNSQVQKGLNEFLFKLFFLRYLMDSDGQMWRCSDKDLYIVELLESTNLQPSCASKSGPKESFAFSDIFPKVNCRSPKEVMASEMRREKNAEEMSDDPLMDDKCFRSEVYQRPYQYLTRFHNNNSLDNFTYHGVEGTHAECLQILLIYCGIIDPSWAELRNFVWFLNFQLQDCENSVFCNSEFVGDTLRGFKNFVVEFMILMSKDFATPSLCITDQSPGRSQIDISGLNEQDLAPFLIRKRWESEPHPYIFFNDDRTSMTFIGFHLELNNQRGVDAINPLTREVIKRNIMTQELYNGLILQRVPFNRDFDQLSRADKIEQLCSVLGIKGSTDPDETYELTTDNVLKMMAIHMRFRCGIPVIVMGETGCGKTRLVKFMCELRKCAAQAENMKLVKVHGGTTSEMIHDKVREAEELARTNKENHGFDTVLFFDEANTTEAISSIKEIICDKTVEGQPLDSQTGLKIVAACNPYRKHTDNMIDRLEASGLGYRVRAEETEDRLGSIPLRQLVYRVHALPPSMIPLVWDFGQLSDSSEQMYIEQIVQRQTKTIQVEKSNATTITKVLLSSQKFMRERKDECSFVSLRDVERCMQVFVWFHRNHPILAEELKTFLRKQSQREKKKTKFSPADDRVIWSLLMATGVCYQACLENKGTYLKAIRQWLPPVYNPERVLKEIQLMQDLLLNGVPMGKTIARNEALKENFFMMVICVELRIPLFIVGKPGSSKSLSKTLVADAMQGPASHSELYKRLKQIHLVSFQCSPHSTPEGIINTFKQCARFQENKNLDEYISVVILDEIGLAEDSCKMPLKTLHPLLEEGCVDDEPQPHKRVGFIGISNWALDPAKMNRGIFVSRGDPNQKELIKSAEGICASEQQILKKIDHLFEPFAKAYMTICEEGRGFFGLRDFYSLIKMIFSITKASNEKPTPDEITGAIQRNFSGKDDVDVMDKFSGELREDFASASISTNDLINQVISPACQVDESRYLLILTKNYAALQILEQILFTHQIHPEIIFGSSFPKDQEYTQICRNINRVKICMETGQTVVLLNLQNLYESLYDALNQYYVTLGGQKYVDLGLGTHRVKCRVHRNFKLIVIEEKEVVYEQFPIPLINRLEKHYVDINTVLRDEQKEIVKQLQVWVDSFVSSSSQHDMMKKYLPSDVFIGYHSDTCSSVVLQVTENDRAETDAQTILEKAKAILLNCATPDSVIRLDKSKLPDEEREHLMKEYVKEEMHSSLGDYIVYQKKQVEESQYFFTEVTTFSRLLTAAYTLKLQNKIKLDNIHLLSLQQFDTEYSFLKKIRECLGSTPADQVLVIQTDYEEDACKRKVFSSAKYACINEINKLATTDNAKPLVYFVTKLPRIEGGTSYVGFQGGPWRSVHIDDLRRSNKFATDVYSLKNLCISEIFEDPPEAMETEDADVPQNDDSTVLEDLFDVTNLLRSCVQSAVSMLRDTADSAELSTKRVENLLTLLDEGHMKGVFANTMRKRIHSLLKDYEANIHNPKSWVLREASNVSALQEGGTFLHTLWRKIQAVVTPLLANLVSVIDQDCNLELLLNGCDDIKNLWLHIFGSKEMLIVPYVRDESSSSVITVQSHSTGGSPMCCCMPFSWWIKDFLDGLMMQTSRHNKPSLGQVMELFLNTPLGRSMNENVNEKQKEEFFQRYLQDFVSMTFKVASDEEELMRDALASCVDEVKRRKGDEDKLSLPLVHIAYRVFQSRLQNLTRMLALQPAVVTPLRRNQHIRNCPEMVLDVYAAQACVECLKTPKLDADAFCQDWLKQVKRLQASLEMICSQQHHGQRCIESLHNVRNGWKRIYILSLFVEHMLLGLQNDENQLRTLVQNYIQTLSRVLEGNADVKSMNPFEAVIKVLKSCKQGASNLIFQFGLECGVCLREPQDPVGLQCHHIFCLTCIKETLGAGNTSCPMCRHELPDNFQPHVSEEARVSVKKNAEFRRRCNGFFIDLLSTVCFKDNTPPNRGVIDHLLSYLTVKTEHTQVQTKDLSPFDESSDKNPVVRSVILKLLLKFSFEDVKDYLQKHLSSVEDSRFVEEEDKAELYALYINCFEDSMWEKMPQGDNKAEELMSFTKDETQFLIFFVSDVTPVPEKVSVQYLQYIARLRLCLTLAAQLISDNVSDGAEDFLNMVIKLCEEGGNDWYRVYLIRKLSERQGVEFVQTLVKQQKFSWLFPAEIHQQNEDGGLMDQFLVYGEEYKAVRDAVAKAAVDGDVDQIEEALEKCTAPPRNRTLFILLALFREVTTLYRSANTGLHPTPEQCQKFEELIEGSRYLHQKEVRDFASALVHNRLGALAMNPNHTATYNAVVELTVHLAAVLLTGTQPLVMPLKQLGLSPENMQGAFIPTMPDDMLAVAQTIIQQVYGGGAWYRCPNNHPCFVGECGRTMGKGKCPDCGLEVGGENEIALPGFRRIQLQQDQTKPGHILGDPEQRNHPDTKNMSLAPFTLVRLVTHLAMLLGASKKPQSFQNIIQPPVEDSCQFLSLHILKDMDQLSQTLGRGADHTVTIVHLVLRSLQQLSQTSHTDTDPGLTTKESRNNWEKIVSADIMTPQLRDLDRLLEEVKESIRTDSRVSSNLIMRTAFTDDCSFLTSLAQGSQVHSSAVWSCREKLSLLSLIHIVEQHGQKEELPLLWRFLQKEKEFQQIKHLSDILILQKVLVRKFQNASDQVTGSIRDFIEKQKVLMSWFEKHINTFLKTWNLLRVSVTSNEMRIPDEFCSDDLSLDSDLQYLLPRRQGPGLCATGLVSYLVSLQNELVNAVDNQTGEDSSYRVSLAELTEQHVIHYELDKDLLPLVLSNCQYSLERGHETISHYDLSRIQQQILTRFLQGKPIITCIGIPTLVKTQERDYGSIFRAVKGKVRQDTLPSLTRNTVSRKLESYSEVCEAFKIVELLLGFLSMTGSDPTMPLVTYLQDVLKMADHIDQHILQALGRCTLRHCVSLWQLLASLKSETMLHLKREPFSEYPAEYQKPLNEEEKIELKRFLSGGNTDQWLLEIHEFLLLRLGRLRATVDYNPSWSVKETVTPYMDDKEVEVPQYVEEKFPENLQLSQIVEVWKYSVTVRPELMEG